MKAGELDETSRTIVSLMDGFPAPWCLAGRWAIDLFLGRITRQHADLEIALLRRDQHLLHRHFSGWTFQKVIDGARHDWSETERLALPVHELHARSGELPPQKLEFLLNESAGSEWVFRRDPTIRLPLADLIVPTAAGVPVLSPAIVLLFKAKAPRPNDEADFAAARLHLNTAQRNWLKAAIERVHPEHPWLQSITPEAGVTPDPPRAKMSGA